MNNRKASLKGLAAAAVMLAAQPGFAEELHVYNWSDYIAEDTIERFQQATGIKVLYDVYDANEVLEAKLLAGNSGYDVIFPTARPFADRHIQAGLYQPLDKSALPQWGNLEQDILASLRDIDPDNQHVVPYMWGTTGIGINVKKVRAILGPDIPLDSWALLFDPALVEKLSACGVSLMDDPTEVLNAAQIYRGQASNDYSRDGLDKAAEVVKTVRPSIRYFHSSQYVNDLANGDLCVAHGYSGDVLQARDRASEAGNGVEIAYLVPREGAVVWTDVMAIPADAPNPAAAHRFINFLLQPDVIAPISNYVAYANGNRAATPLVDAGIRNDPGIYPAPQTRASFVPMKTPTSQQARSMSRIWTRVKTGH